jgi:hypothetical protein
VALGLTLHSAAGQLQVSLAKLLYHQNVARHRTRLLRRSGREFQDGMRRQTHGQAPGRHRVPDFPNLPALVDVDQVDRKLHEERMDRFTRADPQSLTRFQPFAPEQAGAPRGAGIRRIDGMAQDGIACLVPHQYFQF